MWRYGVTDSQHHRQAERWSAPHFSRLANGSHKRGTGTESNFGEQNKHHSPHRYELDWKYPIAETHFDAIRNSTFTTPVAPATFRALAKLRKATFSFVMSVRPHGTTRLPLDRVLLNLYEYFFFRKSIEKIQV
jgi:hypothetical protein